MGLVFSDNVNVSGNLCRPNNDTHISFPVRRLRLSRTEAGLVIELEKAWVEKHLSGTQLVSFDYVTRLPDS